MQPRSPEYDKTYLLDFLEAIDPELKRTISLVAVGGTAMTLLNLKISTIDIDFTAPQPDKSEFERVMKVLEPGVRIDFYTDGLIYSQQLPNDYIKKSILIDLPKGYNIKNTVLKALNPIDIIITKIARLNARDRDDIRECIKRYRPAKEEIRTRARSILKSYPANEAVYKMNLKSVLSLHYQEMRDDELGNLP